MALVTPIVNDIPALDATQINFIGFTANGGEQIVKNEIKILTNDISETIVYSNVQTTHILGQSIPANTLTNGTYYKVAFRTYDASDNSSEWSNYQPFYCYTAPTLSFNMSNGEIVHSADFDLVLTYNQAQNERLGSTVIYFYDEDDNLISSSGNLFNTNLPPVSFSYYLRGLDNHKVYKIKADGFTVNNTPITTGMVFFYVSYQTIDSEGELYATVNSCDGYINVKSSPISNVPVGQKIFNPVPLPYINQNTMLDLTSVVGKVDTHNSYSSWVKWYNIYPVSKFLFRLWFYPSRVTFKIAEFISMDSTNHIIITYNRGSTQDYISIRTYDGTTIDKGLGTICNGNTRVFLWMKVTEDNWDVQTEILSNPTTVLEWDNNTNNNMYYNVTTDIKYGNESYGNFTPSTNIYSPLTGRFNVVVVGNGIFDELDLSLNTGLPYTHNIPTEDMSAVLFVHFNGNVNNDVASSFSEVVLLKKFNKTWDMVKKINVPQNSVVELEWDDYFVPNGLTQSYALSVYRSGIPSLYYTLDVVPKWGRVFLSDKDESYKLNYAVIYSDNSQNIQNGVLMPIGATYPIVIQNAEGNYRSGSLQFKVLGYQFEIDKHLDRNSIVEQTNDIVAFLTNSKPKCIKDYNGNIYMCKVINSPKISYDANWGNGITTVSFDWVEQGKYNSHEDMVDLGFVDEVQ